MKIAQSGGGDHGRSGLTEGAHDVQGRRLGRRCIDDVRPDARQGRDADVHRRRSDADVLRAERAWSCVDPAAKKPTLDFFTTNYEQLKVRLYEVDAGRLRRVRPLHARTGGTTISRRRCPATKVFDQLVKTTQRQEPARRDARRSDAGADKARARPRDRDRRAVSVEGELRAAAHDRVGAVDAARRRRARRRRQPASRSRPSSAPASRAAGVELEIRPFGIEGARPTTRASRRSRSARARSRARTILVAQRGDDVAFVADDGGWWNEYGSWVKQPREQAARLVRDRRSQDVQAGRGGLAQGLAAHDRLRQERRRRRHRRRRSTRDVQGDRLAAATRSRRARRAVSAVGGFDTKFTLPKTPNLGYAYVQFETQGRCAAATRTASRSRSSAAPSSRCRAQASQGPFLVGGSGDVTVNAKYYAGGPLPGAPVNWYVTASQTSFTPPNRDDYVFGSWEPWWGYHGFVRRGAAAAALQAAEDVVARGQDRRDRRARAAHGLPVARIRRCRCRCSANASVTDVNRQTWSASAALIVHPSSLYVGLKTKKPFVEKGTPFDLDVIGVDLDGKAAIGAPIEVKAVRLDWEYKKGKYTQKEVDPQTCAVTAATDPAPCTFATTKGGTYQVDRDDRRREGPAEPDEADVLGHRRRAAAGARGRAGARAADPRQEGVRGRRHRRAAAAGAVLSGRGRRDVAAQRHRQDRADHARRADGGRSRCRSPTRWCRTCTCRSTSSAWRRAPTTTAIRIRSCRSARRTRWAPSTCRCRRSSARSRSTVAPDAPKLGARRDDEARGRGHATRTGRPVANAEAAVIVVDEAILALDRLSVPESDRRVLPQRGTDTRDFYLRAYVKLARPDAGAARADGARRRRRAVAARGAATPTTVRGDACRRLRRRQMAPARQHGQPRTTAKMKSRSPTTRRTATSDADGAGRRSRPTPRSRSARTSIRSRRSRRR